MSNAIDNCTTTTFANCKNVSIKSQYSSIKLIGTKIEMKKPNPQKVIIEERTLTFFDECCND